MKRSKSRLACVHQAIFHCSRFARAGEATNFNHVKNQSRGHAKACPRAVKARHGVSASSQADNKSAQVRQLERKLSNVRSARAGKATAMEIGLYISSLLHIGSEDATRSSPL
jgi:hypothetical protein